MASRACDGASDPTPNVARGRRLDGGSSCWSVQNPGGLGQPLAGNAVSNVDRTAGRLSGSRSEATAPTRGLARTKDWPGTEIAVDAGAERRPVGRETAPEG